MGWPKSSCDFFLKIVWKNLNALFGQCSISTAIAFRFTHVRISRVVARSLKTKEMSWLTPRKWHLESLARGPSLRAPSSPPAMKGPLIGTDRGVVCELEDSGSRLKTKRLWDPGECLTHSCTNKLSCYCPSDFQFCDYGSWGCHLTEGLRSSQNSTSAWSPIDRWEVCVWEPRRVRPENAAAGRQEAGPGGRA